jgi:L-histidine N-alpha-methyltransferase
MDLPEYYLTSCEWEILRGQRDVIASWVGTDPFRLVELGPGDGQKVRVLLEHFSGQGMDFRYVPIDISRSAVESLCRELDRDLPVVRTEGLVSDYFDGLKWLAGQPIRRNVVLFLGSNIGNFSHSEARGFLYSLWNVLGDGDGMVIGFDLKKDIDTLQRAYDDSQGVTAEFNVNLLRRINRELGGNFDPDRFRFYASYNAYTGAVESFLISRCRQSVFIEALNHMFVFDAWEPIHTECSHKYLPDEIRSLADETGFLVSELLHDSRRYFVDALWRVKKGPRAIAPGP